MLEAEQHATLGDWKITPTFEHRIRYERRLDRDFLSSSTDNSVDWLFRTRLGFRAADKRGNKVVLVYQRSYDDQVVAGKTNPIHNSDVAQLYWEHATANWTVTVGRWPYKLGDGRLICSQGAWGNLGRTFEGILVKGKMGEAAAFKEAVNTPSNKEVMTGFASAKTSAGQTSLIYRQNERGSQDSKLFTLNHLYKAKSGPWIWTMEGSFQWGIQNDADHAAYAVTVQASRALGKRASAYVEGSLASGGSGPKSQTFDPLYQSAVPPYGLRSQIGFRNLAELTFGAAWQVDRKLKLEGVWTLANLLNGQDGWYSISGGLNRRPGGVYIDPTGRSGRQIGSFVQLEATFAATSHDTFGAGIGAFFPGRFVERQLGTKPDTQVWGYVQYMYRF